MVHNETSAHSSRKLNMDRILVIDDDVELCSLVQEYLQAEGFSVESVHDGERGLQRATAGGYLLAVLDVMLPGINGFEVLRRIRATSRLPVLLLTARGEDVDRIVGLEIGADDYLPKPFNPRELVARIRAILRRSRSDGKAVPATPEICARGRSGTRSRNSYGAARRPARGPHLRRVQSAGSSVARGRTRGSPRAPGECRAQPKFSRLTAASICTSARCARSWATRMRAPITMSTLKRFVV
jgi:DNA-binding response OmpR family regulator